MKNLKELFETVAALDEGTHDICDIHLASDSMDTDITFRLYFHLGYCFEIEKQQHCEADEIEEYADIHELQDDGATYHFDDMGSIFEGFKELAIEEALKLNIH